MIYTIEQMRALEWAADEAGHSYGAMMEAAGVAVAEAVVRAAPLGARRALVLAGPGNNGGDGLVAARLLAARGWSVVAYAWKRARDEPLAQRARAQKVALLWAEEDAGGALLQRALHRAEVVVDALFGTGLARPLEGQAQAILAALARRRAAAPDTGLHWVGAAPARPAALPRPCLVAVDLPSGLHGDSGEADPATVAADVTVTFAGPKRGMVRGAALPLLGALVVADIGIPAPIRAQAAHEAALLGPETVRPFLPPRPADGHKGTFGTTMIVGGSLSYVGAPALSALAAGRSGAGLVTLAVPAPLHPILAAHHALATATWRLLGHDMAVLRDKLAGADALLVGPGLGAEEPTRRFVWQLLGLEGAGGRGGLGFVRRPSAEEGARVPLALPPTVVDADGLNALAAWQGAWWEGLTAPLVLTPHPGEMARLLHRETSEVQGDRLATAREAARRFGQVVVLKGAATVVAAPDGRAAIAPYASDALAKAGSGDVLAGIIAALLGQGLPPFEAAGLAVVAHALAGLRLAERLGGQAALASELLDELPAVWQRLRGVA